MLRNAVFSYVTLTSVGLFQVSCTFLRLTYPTSLLRIFPPLSLHVPHSLSLHVPSSPLPPPNTHTHTHTHLLPPPLHSPLLGLDPLGPNYTWRGSPGVQVADGGKYYGKGMRIDYALVSKAILPLVVSTQILGNTHCTMAADYFIYQPV